MTPHVVPSGQAHTTGLHVDDVGRDVYVVSCDPDATAFVDAFAAVLNQRNQTHPFSDYPSFLAGAMIRFVQSPRDSLLTFQFTFPK